MACTQRARGQGGADSNSVVRSAVEQDGVTFLEARLCFPLLVDGTMGGAEHWHPQECRAKRSKKSQPRPDLEGDVALFILQVGIDGRAAFSSPHGAAEWKK